MKNLLFVDLGDMIKSILRYIISKNVQDILGRYFVI
jgi:hypothetical protein|tara:strand:- start:2550 stop:2657 length:108 start_codon:yes stop_codon:yes gene_type:complete